MLAIASRRRSALRCSVVVLGHEPERLAVEHHRVVFRPAALRLLGGTGQLRDRPLEVARIAPVVGERADRLVRRAGRPLEELRDRLVASRAVGAR